ncbi:MAG: DUF389 domain-containing protein [Hyphomicrobiales bacterium]
MAKDEGGQGAAASQGAETNGSTQVGWQRLGRLTRTLTNRQRDRILNELFLRKDSDFLLYLWRFCVLLCFSTIIASLGLLQNSTAVVIGAMLVAPFMEPILASAAALVMSWPRRFLRSLFLVLCGAVVSFAMAYLISKATPDIEWASHEVMTRTKPNLYDLGIAAAAGAAAVFTMIYRINAAAPGVAVAVALLPPLAAAGIVAEQRLYDEAVGALLLFVTNFATILLVASLTLLVHGFVPRLESIDPKKLARRGIFVTLLFCCAISIPLFQQTRKLFDEIRLEGATQRALKSWYQGVPQEVHKIEAKGANIKVFMSGPDFERDHKLLAKMVSKLAGKPVRLEVKWLKIKTINETYFEVDKQTEQ